MISAAIAMMMIVSFVGYVVIFGKLSIKDETISIWKYVGQQKNRSAILLIVCLLIYGYNLLYLTGALPPLYYGTLLQGYHRLVELGITGKDQKKPVEFKTRYEKFVRKYSRN